MPALKPATIGQKFLTDCGQNRPLTTPKCKVILRDFSGNEMDVFIDDEELYSKNINTGDHVHFVGDEIFKD